MERKLKDSPFINVFLFSFFWAINIFIGKLAYNSGAKPVSYSLQTATIAIVFLFLILRQNLLKEFQSISKKTLFIILGINAIHFGVGGFLSAAGLALTSAINASFLGKLATVFTTILALIILKEKMNHKKGLIIIILLFGSFFISTKGKLITPHIGDILIILAALSWSTANVLVRKYLKNSTISGDLISFLRPIVGIPTILTFILLAPLYPNSVKEVFQVPLFDITLWIYVVLGGISVSLLWIYLNRTLKLATASYMTMMSMITPVITTILAILFLNESIHQIQVLGGSLIIFSGIITHKLKV